jgi:hypothetical protein
LVSLPPPPQLLCPSHIEPSWSHLLRLRGSNAAADPSKEGEVPFQRGRRGRPGEDVGDLLRETGPGTASANGGGDGRRTRARRTRRRGGTGQRDLCQVGPPSSWLHHLLGAPQAAHLPGDHRTHHLLHLLLVYYSSCCSVCYFFPKHTCFLTCEVPNILPVLLPNSVRKSFSPQVLRLAWIDLEISERMLYFALLTWWFGYDGYLTQCSSLYLWSWLGSVMLDVMGRDDWLWPAVLVH